MHDVLPAWVLYIIGIACLAFVPTVVIWAGLRYQPRSPKRRVGYWLLRSATIAIGLSVGLSVWWQTIWRLIPTWLALVVWIAFLLDIWQMAYLTHEQAVKWLAIFMTLFTVVVAVIILGTAGHP